MECTAGSEHKDYSSSFNVIFLLFNSQQTFQERTLGVDHQIMTTNNILRPHISPTNTPPSHPCSASTQYLEPLPAPLSSLDLLQIDRAGHRLPGRVSLQKKPKWRQGGRQSASWKSAAVQESLWFPTSCASPCVPGCASHSSYP